MYPVMFLISLVVIALLFAVIVLKFRSLQKTCETLGLSLGATRQLNARTTEKINRDLETLEARVRDVEARVRVAESYARAPYGLDER